MFFKIGFPRSMDFSYFDKFFLKYKNSLWLCSYVIDKKQTLIIAKKKLEIGLNSASLLCGCTNWSNCIKKGHNSPISNHPVIIDWFAFFWRICCVVGVSSFCSCCQYVVMHFVKNPTNRVSNFAAIESVIWSPVFL